MPPLTYSKAGVDIDRADTFIKAIRPWIEKTRRPEVLGSIGGFSGLFRPDLSRMKEPVLVSSTDGVGTKLLLAELQDRHDTVGIDLVAMCVDDVVVVGAEPLFFLDYIACGKLSPAKHVALVKGISRGCRRAGCALVGGETAEMPGMYSGESYDLAGFCLGLVDRTKILDGSGCRPGDRLIGLASSGVHSNGFSLVRKVFTPEELRGPLGKALLAPTRIYARTCLELLSRVRIKAMAHITGGGLTDNIPRVLTAGLGARIAIGSWPVPALFKKIQARGGISDPEMFRTFNMGVGMVLVTSRRSTETALSCLAEKRQKAWVIGELVEGRGNVVYS